MVKSIHMRLTLWYAVILGAILVGFSMVVYQIMARLEAAFQRQQQFTADAAHELRTPLAVMKNEIGVALNHPRGHAEYQRVLVVMNDEVDRLTRLTADLLVLTRGDSQPEALVHEHVDLSGLLGAVAEQTQILARSRELGFEAAIPSGLHMLGDPDQLVRLFINLLDNAIYYTPIGGQVQLIAHRVELDKRGYGQCTVEIRDTGEGIAPEHLPQIFERFYRGDQARSRASGGAGLGLAIARQIAEAHSGTIAVRSTVGQGSTFRVTLQTTPAKSSASSPRDSIKVSH